VKLLRIVLGIFALTAGILWTAPAVSGETAVEQREWTNSKGQTILASMVGFRSELGWEYVSIQRSDGRTFEIALSDLSVPDQDYARSHSQNFTNNSEASAESERQPERTAFEESARKHLVWFDGKRLDDWESTGEPSYYAIYYSAGWCGPCRRFTPDLVKFYDRNYDRYGNFEVIFVSSDRSEDDMEEYMDEAEMPWPALEFDQKKKARDLTQFSERGIPNLVVVDRNGKVLSTSYVDGSYRGPSTVLDELEDLVKEG